MGRPRRDTGKLGSIQARHGVLMAGPIASEYGIAVQHASCWLRALMERGEVRRIDRGRYMLSQNGNTELVGVPLPDGIRPEIFADALEGLTGVFRLLSIAHDEAKHAAMREWLEGALREQSKQCAMIALMKGL